MRTITVSLNYTVDGVDYRTPPFLIEAHPDNDTIFDLAGELFAKNLRDLMKISDAPASSATDHALLPGG